MIVSMTKYEMLLYHADLPALLEGMQELGIVDIQRSARPVDEASVRLMEEISRYTAALKHLDKVKADIPSPAVTSDEAAHIVERTEELVEERAQLRSRAAVLRLEVEVSRPWGNWGTRPIEQLKQLSVTPHFYSCKEKAYKPEWEQEYILKEVSRMNGMVYFVVLEQAGAPYAFPLAEAKLPMASVDVLEAELENIAVRLQAIERHLQGYALQKETVEDSRRLLLSQLDIYLAGKASRAEAENMLTVLSAFVPEEQQRTLTNFLDSQQVIYLSAPAVIEDNPPVQLKNNRFARLFEPVGSMFMPPRYDELDVTAYFSPFYMLFFGLCLGDMGYGLLLILCGGLAKLKFPKMKPLLSLVQLLGLGSTIMPLTTGAFFGMKLGELFHIEGVFLDDLQMFWLAIAFGAIQIIYAKIIHAIDSIKRLGFQHGLDHLGWALLMIDGGLLVASSFLGMAIPPVVMTVLLYLSLALIVFFTNKSGNIFVRVGKGLASFYDVTGIFGDLLSYIRLFGLGTAGGILGFVVNTVGAMIWEMPYVGWLFGGIMFVVGHIAVLALGALGAFVHPMRLTFVEFYKNVGFVGGGRIYKPLRK